MNKLSSLLVWILFSSCCFGQTAGSGVIDVDGNTYNTVIIGVGEWTKENLNVSKYTDGTIIPQVADPSQWANLTTGAWCYYGNDTGNGTIYGKLYNWYAVAGIYNVASFLNPTLRKQLAPQGWHIPSDEEWNLLTASLGGGMTAGGKMKEIGTNHWLTPNTDATNESGFAGLPGGGRTTTGQFFNINNGGRWWSSLQNNDAQGSTAMDVGYNYGGAFTLPFNYAFGFSVRCLKGETLSNAELISNSFKIYPNPANEYITIEFGISTNVIGYHLEILNPLGQVVYYQLINAQHSNISLKSLSGQGTYFLRVLDTNNYVLSTKKLILK